MQALKIIYQYYKKSLLFNILRKINIQFFSDALDICSQSTTSWVTFPKVCWLLPLKCDELETQILKDPLKITHSPKSIQSGANKKGAVLFYWVVLGWFFCIYKFQSDLSFTITTVIHKVPAVSSSLGVGAHSTSSNKISAKVKTTWTPQLRTLTLDQYLQIYGPHGLKPDWI